MVKARPGHNGSRSEFGESVYFESIVNLAVDAFLVLNSTGVPVYFNRSFLYMWQLPENTLAAGDILGHLASGMSNPDAFLSRVNAAPGTYDEIGERLYLDDGRIIHSVVWPLVREGIDRGQVWNFRDITDRVMESQRARDAVEEKERRFRALVENASDLITVVAPDSTILYQSPASKRALGFEAEELTGSTFFDLLHPEDMPVVDGLFSRATHLDEQPAALDVRLRDVAGAWHYVGIRVTDRRQDAEIGGLILNIRDVTSRHLLEQELQHQATHDPLTGLLNRRGFRAEFQASLDGGRTGALLLFDLDDFKDINDSLGHQAGDRVLVELAELLRREMGDDVIAGRLGGDEFAILLRDVTPAQASAVSAGLLTVLRGHTFGTERSEPVDLTTSMGLVAYPRHGKNVEELMSRVDLALYEAKARGRNRLSSFARARNLEAKAEARLKLRHEIRAALKEEGLVLHGQPILHLASDTVSQHELLLRMKQNKGRALAAKSFIDLAERSGLIVPIDAWVLTQALALLSETSDSQASFAVNVSARAFADRETFAWIEGKLKAHCAVASRLIFEVTETAAIADIDNAERFMRTLKEYGCRFSLDDFGVGFSSFHRLRRLPVDFLKIDGSFVRAVNRGAEDEALVRSIVSLAHALHMETIAESVESREQLHAVRRLGVDHAQGYYVGRPRALSRLEFNRPARRLEAA